MQLAAFVANTSGIPLVRTGPQPDPVRRPDHRLDDRARGGGARRAPARRLGDLQPPEGRDEPRHRRDRAVRDRRVEDRADGRPTSRSTRPTTPAASPGCRPARSRAPAPTASAPPRARKETDFLYYVARNDGTGRHYFSTTPEQFERDVQRSRANPGVTIDGRTRVAGHHRVAGRALAVAGDAQRRLRVARPELDLRGVPGRSGPGPRGRARPRGRRLRRASTSRSRTSRR